MSFFSPSPSIEISQFNQLGEAIVRDEVDRARGTFPTPFFGVLRITDNPWEVREVRRLIAKQLGKAALPHLRAAHLPAIKDKRFVPLRPTIVLDAAAIKGGRPEGSGCPAWVRTKADYLRWSVRHELGHFLHTYKCEALGRPDAAIPITLESAAAAGRLSSVIAETVAPSQSQRLLHEAQGIAARRGPREAAEYLSIANSVSVHAAITHVSGDDPRGEELSAEGFNVALSFDEAHPVSAALRTFGPMTDREPRAFAQYLGVVKAQGTSDLCASYGVLTRGVFTTSTSQARIARLAQDTAAHAAMGALQAS